MRSSSCLLATVRLLVLAAALASVPVMAQTAQEGKQPGALSPENLAKRRPKPPFDLTGTWGFSASPKLEDRAWMFDPHPTLTPKAQREYDRMVEYRDKGFDYRDDPGACWPLGVPRMMTRFHPMQLIQLPTMIVLIHMFDHSVRWIYLDGRPHPPEDDIVYTYNGHSIGHWEGSELVVDTVGMTDNHKWIQEGIPSGNQLHVVERIKLVNGGKTMEIGFTMTDPEHWQGEWKSTKRYNREDGADIEEHVCIYEEVSRFPSFRNNIRN